MFNNDSRIFLSPPHMSDFEKEYILDAFQSNWLAPLGPNVDGFEQELASYVGVKGAVALSSATAAIHLALKLVGVERGDRVFCSSFTFVASANPILYEGAEPVFIDSDFETWTMSPVALERALADAKREGKLPKAVVVVNLYGQSADMDALNDLCDAYNVPLIEDAAESLGATYKGKKSGQFGKLGIFSFNGNKIITTTGGGMLVSDDVEALRKARFWATQAKDESPYYHHTEVGYNYRMSNILAGMGRGQLKVIDDRVEARRAVFECYKQAFADKEGINFMPEASYGKSNRWLTVMTVDKQLGVQPLQIVDALEKENIEARPVWKPLHLQPLFAGTDYYSHQEGVSVSDQVFATGVCLPSGSNLSREDQQRVIDCVRRVLG